MRLALLTPFESLACRSASSWALYSAICLSSSSAAKLAFAAISFCCFFQSSQFSLSVVKAATLPTRSANAYFYETVLLAGTRSWTWRRQDRTAYRCCVSTIPAIYTIMWHKEQKHAGLASRAVAVKRACHDLCCQADIRWCMRGMK